MTLITAIQPIRPAAGADAATTGFAIGTVGHADAPTTANAFDNDNTTRYSIPNGTVSAGNAYVGQNFGAGNEQDIIQVAIRNGYTGSVGYGQTSLLVQYSDDNSTWNTAYTWSTVTDDLAAALQTSPLFQSVGKHRYWRLLSNSAGASYWNLYEVEFRPALYHSYIRTDGTSWTLNADNNNGVVTYAVRQAIPCRGYGTQVRVSFQASNTGSYVSPHSSVGIGATLPSTVSTPVELKFSTASGFSLSSSGTIVSDWASLATAPNDILIVNTDLTTYNARFLNPTNSPTNTDMYYKAGASDYATATVSGYTKYGPRIDGIFLVEFR